MIPYASWILGCQLYLGQGGEVSHRITIDHDFGVEPVRASHPRAGSDTAERLLLMRQTEPDPADNRIAVLGSDLLLADERSLMVELSRQGPALHSSLDMDIPACTMGLAR